MDIFGNFSELRGDKKTRRVTRGDDLDFSYSDVANTCLTRLEEKEAPPSSWAMKFLLVLAFSILVGRLFYLQVVHGGDNRKLAEGNRIRPRIIEASRGLVSDKDGVWLARNRPDFALAIYPSDLPKNKENREDVFSDLANITGLTPTEIRDLAAGNSRFFYDSIIIKDHLSHEETLILEEKIANLPGVFISEHSTREYVALPGLAHLLGYIGSVSPEDIENNPDYLLSDRVGKTGIEKVYEGYLRGQHGVEQIEVDSLGNVVRVLVQEENEEPTAGNDVTLYLDRDLQAKTAEYLRGGIEKAKELTGTEINAGVAAVMDVKTGGILALVSLPDYDNNIFTGKVSSGDYQRLIEDKSQPLFDRAIKGIYPPGSVSKIILAAAGLAEGTITPETAFDTPPAIEIGEYVFPDWKDHGPTNVERAIAESNNIFFYSLGGGFDKIRGLGIEKIKEYWQRFGLGVPTGIDLPGEASGLLPDAEWKKRVKNEPWYIGDTYHVSIGQGDLLVTPLQMLRATAVIASGGKLFKPGLVKHITAPDGRVVREYGGELADDQVVAPEIVATVGRGMRQAVTGGSARSLGDLPVTSAGKTGTAQFFDNQKTHAWFEAYAPYEDPEIAVLVLVEGGGGGNETAVPVAKEIMRYYFEQK
ncbi:MAG: penicillin-binding protein 2 [Patescibacteria group bacterium]